MSRAATSRLKVNPPLGTLPVLQYCRPEDLSIDATYQRSLQNGSSQTLIRKIAMFWNWDLCQPLVVARRSDGGLYVVDGQHRLQAAKERRDIAQLPCVVSTYASAADEAASFVALNQQRRPLIALDLFRAALASEDEEATAILREIEGAGLKLAPHMTAAGWKEGMIGNIGGLQRAARYYGFANLGASLRVLARSFDGQVLRYAGTIFPGIAAACHIKGAALDEKRLIGVLKSRGQGHWRSEIMLQRAASDEGLTIAARTVVLAAYDSANATALPSVATYLKPGEMAWCSQCDRRVSGSQADRCASPFCAVKQAKAA
jgi:hypothetical protein